MYVLEFAIALFFLATMPENKSYVSAEPVSDSTKYPMIATEEAILIEGTEYVLRAGMWLSKKIANCWFFNYPPQVGSFERSRRRLGPMRVRNRSGRYEEGATATGQWLFHSTYRDICWWSPGLCALIKRPLLRLCAHFCAQASYFPVKMLWPIEVTFSLTRRLSLVRSQYRPFQEFDCSPLGAWKACSLQWTFDLCCGR